MASTPDGPRYVVGLRDKDDPCCYKDTIEGEKEGEAKEKAEALAAKEGRATIVYDRKEMAIIHRVAGPVDTSKPAPPPPIQKRGRGKKPKQELTS